MEVGFSMNKLLVLASVHQPFYDPYIIMLSEFYDIILQKKSENSILRDNKSVLKQMSSYT